MNELRNSRDLVIAMSERRNVRLRRELLRGAGEINAVLFDTAVGEVQSPASNAHSLSFALTGESHHRRWKNNREVMSGILPDQSLSLIEAGVTPRAVIGQSTRSLHVYLPHAMLQGKAAMMGLRKTGLELIDPQFRTDDVLVSLCKWLASSLLENRPADALYRDSIMEALTVRLLDGWSNAGDGLGNTAFGGLSALQLRRALEAMENTLDADIGLDDLARIAGCSSWHFSRAFKQSTGIAPFRWLHERRITKAKELLADPRLSLADVGSAVGFSAQSQFTTAFGRATGVTPGRWRKGSLL